ncbi:MAG: UDP-N-acetylglucosamine 2-epimerase (non-hydrolyzing) [Candidatus Harrisonbacteria bacterium CG10_big_fil_rev_8_21_14_0_10_40_38]|uniref:UDP-N-acetylglucosamine 2-epimerase (Non-hydrolyzing) n=1 Tax=Candidatus Harrisonbacteria bacterium CG10_big_fil_rev_8_21_14_0_10_40_38 TaxID=1974583 RepID=A0A2H0UR57_9BACT|nr:MAG: UDP-N-acetylglucosamine 2-epimerase (non-hydrolyzing) [Candidatus Harrisonbacteria bacterium CG10_big_fil_rev_8_21_14_0_10_40_38]
MISDRKIRVMLIVGARPNFMKAAPLIKAMNTSPFFDVVLVHTGQHYDANMSDDFFNDLDIPKPDISLGVGSGTHAEQTAKIMMALETSLVSSSGLKPDLVMVVGDVNSTIAAALTAKKLHIPVAHVEAGLRSFDEKMPEEINRVLTDRISDFLFTTEKSANDNLQREGVPQNKIHFTGNVMIDSLLKNQKKIDASKILEKENLEEKKYGVITLHRPSNVDNVGDFAKLITVSEKVAEKIPLIFPVHPRTKNQLKEAGIKTNAGIRYIEPLGYADFMKLVKNAKLVLTDSGGIQEETTVLGIPCITLRDNTERPITVEVGTNIVTSSDKDKIMREVNAILTDGGKKGNVPMYWDGKASERIVEIILNHFRKL